MRRNEDYPSYYYKDIEGTAEIGLERSAGEPFRELKVYGESVQNGTPSPDNPIKVESVGDRTPQLFNLPTSGEISWYANSSGLAPKGIRNPDGSITFDGTNGDDVVKNMQKIFGDSEKMIIEETGIYAFSCKNASSAIYMTCRLPNGSGGFAYQTIATSSRVVYATIEQGTEITVYLQVGKNASVSNRTLYPMMQKVDAEGDAVSDFEPYGYKADIEVMNGDEIKETIIYLKEPLRKIGDYADELDVIGGKATRNIFEYTFTGNETWVSPQTPLDNTIRSTVYYKDMPRVRSNCGWIGFSEKGIFDGVSTVSGDAERCQFSNYADTYSAFYARILKSRCADPENPAKSDFENIYTPGTKVYGVRETPIEEPIVLSDEIKTLKRNCQLRVKTSLSPSKVKAQYYRY